METHTPITEERFLAWKKKKADEKEAADKAKRKQRKADIKSGVASMSGREMFAANPEMFVDDDLAEDIKREEEEDDPSVPVNIITATGTSITRTAVKKETKEEPASVEVDESLFGGDEDFD